MREKPRLPAVPASLAAALLLLPLPAIAGGSFRQGATAAALAGLCLLFRRLSASPRRQGLLLGATAAWAAGELAAPVVGAALLAPALSLLFLFSWHLVEARGARLPGLLCGLTLAVLLLAQGRFLWGTWQAAERFPLAAAALAHPTRVERAGLWGELRLAGLSLYAPLPGDARTRSQADPHWSAQALALAPLRLVGQDAYREAFQQRAALARNPLAGLVFFGGDLKLRAENRCVSLDYNPAAEELAILREGGELLLISPAGRRLHLFTGDLGKAARVRATPDGAGFLCLFERGETRYFGADSPFACTGELKFGMGRVVDFVFDEPSAGPIALNAAGGLYALGAGGQFRPLTPPLFPDSDRARGLAVLASSRPQSGDLPAATTLAVLDCHGEVHFPASGAPSLRFVAHAFPAPDDDAVVLRAWGADLVWMDAWGGLHGIAFAPDALRNPQTAIPLEEHALAYGDLAPRVRRGECTDFALLPAFGRVLALNGFGEVASFDLERYALRPNREAHP